MTVEILRIVDQLERAYDGDAWHGPTLRGLLADVDAPTAAMRPAASGHTIWELTEHVTFWMTVVRRRLAGEIVNGDDDWQPVGDMTPERWRETLAALDASHKRLSAAIRVLADRDLERQVPEMGYTNYVMLHGVVQHNLYHAGQIAILQRMIRPER